MSSVCFCHLCWLLNDVGFAEGVRQLWRIEDTGWEGIGAQSRRSTRRGLYSTILLNSCSAFKAWDCIAVYLIIIYIGLGTSVGYWGP